MWREVVVDGVCVLSVAVFHVVRFAVWLCRIVCVEIFEVVVCPPAAAVLAAANIRPISDHMHER